MCARPAEGKDGAGILAFALFLLTGSVLTVLTSSLILHAVRERGRLSRDRVRLARFVAALLFVPALVLYLSGLLATWDGGESPYHACSMERFGKPDPPGDTDADRPGFRAREVTLFPAAAECRWSDGTFDTVPGHVNPGILACLAGSAALTLSTVMRSGDRGDRAGNATA